MNKKNIAYVFISGRKEKIESLKENYAKEFFYGYQYFEKKGHNMKIIEFDKKKSFFSSVYFILNKLSDLPIYGQNLINKTIPCLQTLEGKLVKPHLYIINQKNNSNESIKSNSFGLYLINRVLI